MSVGILAIDDEHVWRKRFVGQLAKATPTKVITADRPEMAFSELANNPGICVVLIDQDLQAGGKGSDLCQKMRAQLGDDKVLIGVSSSANPADVSAFKVAGADGYAVKAGLRNGLHEALSYPSTSALIPRSYVPIFTDPIGFISERLLEGN